MSDKIDISMLKQTDITLDKKTGVSDEALENVSGGYKEWGGYAAGFEIKCPFCGRSDASDFTGYEENHEANLNAYRCICGNVFAVDMNGRIWK